MGIGTTAPGARLMVVGTPGAPTLNIVPDATNPGDPAIRVNEDGNVGLGTTTPSTKLEVSDGDVYLSNPNTGIILTSPNGNCYRVTVNMQGQLQNTLITCPN